MLPTAALNTADASRVSECQQLSNCRDRRKIEYMHTCPVYIIHLETTFKHVQKHMHALTSTNKSRHYIHHTHRHFHTDYKALKGNPYMQFRHYNKNGNLYFTPLLIHQSEHHWGADYAVSLAHQHCLNSSQPVPEGL